MKLDLKKELGKLYKCSTKKFEIVNVPPLNVISVAGQGDPNTALEFKNAIEARYPVAYSLKFAYKATGQDFSVMPLEGLWWTPDMKDFSPDNKDAWLWKIFIVQPGFVTKEAFDKAITTVKQKKNPAALTKVKFETLKEETAAQILYVGSFAAEGPVIQKLHDFIKQKGHSFDGLKQKHHEIYLSDMRRTPPDKQKVIIRQAFI